MPNTVHNNKTYKTKWDVRASELARNTQNLIRYVVEGIKIEPNPEKPMIPLSIGDPTTFGNLKTSETVVKAVKKVINESKHNGYAPSTGFDDAKKAVAKYVAHQGNVTSNDIILCSGCSSSLDLCITALAEKGQNILIPRPGFALYKTLSEGLGIEVKYYNLIPHRQWEIDLEHLESLIDENTAAFIVNNPSNPCGSVFSREHLENILKIAEKHFIPIIADEIYEHFVFPGSQHIAISSLSKNVPILSCGGLTKRFLVPGWRMGWVVVHDRNNVLKDIIKGLRNLSGRILGPNTIIQGALPEILANTPESFYNQTTQTIHKNALLTYDILKDVHGLRPIMPSGAMYIMIGIDIEHFPEYSSDLHFVQDLVKEQSVFCLPGSCFNYPNYMRIVLTVPDDMIREACSRIAEFCEQHYKRDNRIIESNLLEAIDFENN